jgi:hypothetical protein
MTGQSELAIQAATQTAKVDEKQMRQPELSGSLAALLCDSAIYLDPLRVSGMKFWQHPHLRTTSSIHWSSGIMRVAWLSLPGQCSKPLRA